MAYFSNSTEGSILDAQCEECLHGLNEDITCPIKGVHWRFNSVQIDVPKLRKCLTMLVDDKHGICQMKLLINRFYKAKPVEEQGEEKPE